MIFKDLFRRTLFTLMTVSIFAVSVLFVYIFYMSIEGYKTQLDELSLSVEVKVRVIDSNDRSTRVYVETHIIDKFLSGESVKSYDAEIQAVVGYESPRIDNYSNFIYGVSDLRAFADRRGYSLPDLSAEEIAGFNRDENICLVTSAFLESYSIEIGDTITVCGDPTRSIPALASLTIAGVIDMPYTFGSDIVVPELYLRTNYNLYYNYYYLKVEFIINPAYNMDLYDVIRNAEGSLSSSAKKYECLYGTTFFDNVIEPLKKRIETLSVLFPIISAGIAVAEIALTIVLAGSCKKDVLILRLMGQKNRKVFFNAFQKSLIPDFLAVALSLLILLPAYGGATSFLWLLLGANLLYLTVARTVLILMNCKSNLVKLYQERG